MTESKRQSKRKTTRLQVRFVPIILIQADDLTPPTLKPSEAQRLLETD